MKFVILRLLKHNELGMFHAYRRRGKEGSKQRAINFDGDIVDRVFPTAKDDDVIELQLAYETDDGIRTIPHRIKRQEKNWRFEGNCPHDELYDFVDPGCLFAMIVDAGTRPATGAWAVFAQDDGVTAAIGSHAESSQLTSQSMVALYGSEGGYILDLLRDAKPELFGTRERTGPDVGHQLNTVREGRVHLPPDPKRLVRILASVGHSFPSAVADIIDNAISAGATEIDIRFSAPDQGHGRWMTVTDNGRGMDEGALAEAMRIGSAADYEAGDLGKYGYGLKGASWSQAESFTVVSKVAGRPAHDLSWDAGTMQNWEASRSGIERWMESHIKVRDHGTCVFWRDMRPPKQHSAAKGVDPYTAEVRDLARHLGLVFHRFIAGQARGRSRVTIRINGDPVEANSPVGHPLTIPYARKPIRVPTATTDANVDVQAFLLPSEDQIKEQHRGDAEAIRKDLDRIGLYGKRNESQGVYVYRNDRLIQWGGWHEMWKTSDEKTKLARVVVEFGEALDDQFSVNISKQQVTLPMQLQEHIKKLAEEARKDSRLQYRPERSPKKPSGGPGRSPTPPAPPPTPPPPSTAGGGAPDPGPRPKGDLPRIRPVRNPSFAWKISKSMTGQEEIQIAESETDLCNLFEAVRNDPDATSHLACFLRRLDRADVQQRLTNDDAPR
jgi:hypothetical protein